MNLSTDKIITKGKPFVLGVSYVFYDEIRRYPSRYPNFIYSNNEEQARFIIKFGKCVMMLLSDDVLNHFIQSFDRSLLPSVVDCVIHTFIDENKREGPGSIYYHTGELLIRLHFSAKWDNHGTKPFNVFHNLIYELGEYKHSSVFGNELMRNLDYVQTRYALIILKVASLKDLRDIGILLSSSTDDKYREPTCIGLNECWCWRIAENENSQIVEEEIKEIKEFSYRYTILVSFVKNSPNEKFACAVIEKQSCPEDTRKMLIRTCYLVEAELSI